MSQFLTLYCLPGDLGKGVHKFGTDTIKVALTNSAPSVTASKKLSDITQISAGNGYVSGGSTATGTSYVESPFNSGIWKFSADDVEFTASGGAIGPFRYAVFYNDTATDDPLIGYLDFGSSITLADGNGYMIRIPSATGIMDVGAGTIP